MFERNLIFLTVTQLVSLSLLMTQLVKSLGIKLVNNIIIMHFYNTLSNALRRQSTILQILTTKDQVNPEMDQWKTGMQPMEEKLYERDELIAVPRFSSSHCLVTLMKTQFSSGIL